MVRAGDGLCRQLASRVSADEIDFATFDRSLVPTRKRSESGESSLSNQKRYATFWILPLRKHRVHTSIRLTPPPTEARTSFKFGCHRRLVLLFAWLTLLPTD